MSTKKFPPIPLSSRKAVKVPVIIREYLEDGCRYYESRENKIWAADVFDRIFIPTKLKIIQKLAPIGTKPVTSLKPGK